MVQVPVDLAPQVIGDALAQPGKQVAAEGAQSVSGQGDGQQEHDEYGKHRAPIPKPGNRRRGQAVVSGTAHRTRCRPNHEAVGLAGGGRERAPQTKDSLNPIQKFSDK